MTEWWQNLSWSEAAGWACMGFVAVLAIYGALMPRPRNKRKVLPPPSAACKRRTPEAVP